MRMRISLIRGTRALWRARDMLQTCDIRSAGGRSAAEMEAAAREGKQLPGLHSPFWAPEADKVIAAGAEALVASTLELMPRK